MRSPFFCCPNESKCHLLTKMNSHISPKIGSLKWNNEINESDCMEWFMRLHHEKNGCKNGIQNFSANSYAWPFNCYVYIKIIYPTRTDPTNFQKSLCLLEPMIWVEEILHHLGCEKNPMKLRRSLWNKFTSKWLTWRSAMRLWISVLLDIIGQLPFILQTNFKFHIGYTERMAFKRYFPFKY